MSTKFKFQDSDSEGSPERPKSSASEPIFPQKTTTSSKTRAGANTNSLQRDNFPHADNQQITSTQAAPQLSSTSLGTASQMTSSSTSAKAKILVTKTLPTVATISSSKRNIPHRTGYSRTAPNRTDDSRTDSHSTEDSRTSHGHSSRHRTDLSRSRSRSREHSRSRHSSSRSPPRSPRQGSRPATTSFPRHSDTPDSSASTSVHTLFPRQAVRTTATPSNSLILNRAEVTRIKNAVAAQVCSNGGDEDTVDRYSFFGQEQLEALEDILSSRPAYSSQNHYQWGHKIFFNRIEAIFADRPSSDITTALEQIPFKFSMDITHIQELINKIRSTITTHTALCLDEVSEENQTRSIQILLNRWQRTAQTSGTEPDRRCLLKLKEKLQAREITTIKHLATFFYSYAYECEEAIRLWSSFGAPQITMELMPSVFPNTLPDSAATFTFSQVRSHSEGNFVEVVSDSEKLCFNLMRNTNVIPFREVDADDATRKEIFLEENVITRINFRSINLQAFALPKGLNWPTAIADKQRSVTCPNLYLHRGGRPNDGRVAMTIEILRAGNDVVWLGSPGIGKTWGLNYILMEFLRNLGEPGWPPNVLLRVSNTLYHFVLSEGDLSIRKVSAATLLDAVIYCEGLHKGWVRPDAVMLLELQESETDPRFGFPVFTTTSSRDSDVNLKTMRKSGSISMVVDPWKEDEVRAATIAQYIMRRTSTIDDDLRIAMGRFEKIGGLPRHIFTTNLKYQAYLAELTPTEGRDLKSIQNMRIYNIPEDMKFYIAPFVPEGVEVPLISASTPVYEFDYLSEYVKKLFIRLIKTPEEVEMLRRFGVRFQIDEAIVKHGGLLLDSLIDMDPKYHRGEWEWYRDPGSMKISQKCKLSDIDIPELPWCNSEVKFSSQHLRTAANKLIPRACYTSMKHYAPVADMIVVNKDERVVYAVQVTGLDMSKHCFSENSLKEFMRNLGLLNNSDKPTGGYRLCIIAVTDWSRPASRGVMTYVDKPASATSLSKCKEPWAKIVDCYIVRACLSSGSVENKLLVEN